MTILAFADAYAAGYRPYKGGAWCYEDGCLYRGLLLLHDVTGEERWLGHVLRLAAPQIGPDGALAGYDPAEYNIDNIQAGSALFALSDATGDPRYLAAAGRLAAQLDTHPRISRGNYWHKAIYPHQVWLDGLYMALPFQIEFGLRQDRPELVADALGQFETALTLTRRADGLYAHGYDEARRQGWADPETGRNAALWARSLGWLAMALADATALVPDARTAPHAEALRELLLSLARLATPEGLWMQVPDRPDLEGNYAETSASAMIAYACLSAARRGIWPEGERVGQRALDFLSAHRLAHDPEAGRDRLSGICQVAGLGGAVGRRDGSAAYYLSEPVVPDDPKGVGPFLMAASERLRIDCPEGAA